MLKTATLHLQQVISAREEQRAALAKHSAASTYTTALLPCYFYLLSLWLSQLFCFITCMNTTKKKKKQLTARKWRIHREALSYRVNSRRKNSEVSWQLPQYTTGTANSAISTLSLIFLHLFCLLALIQQSKHRTLSCAKGNQREIFMSQGNLCFLITQQTIAQYNKKITDFTYFDVLTLTWLKSPTLLLSWGLRGLVSTLGLTTCRKGLESGSPLTLIPSGKQNK